MEPTLLEKLTASIEEHGIEGGNILMLDSVTDGDLASVQYLLTHTHALIDAVDEQGNNALLLAILSGHYHIVEFLLNNLATLLTHAGQGNNPLELLNRTNQDEDDPWACIISSEPLSNDPIACMQMCYLLLRNYERYLSRADLIETLRDFFTRGKNEALLPQELLNLLSDAYPELADPVAQITQGVAQIQLPMDEQTGDFLYLNPNITNPFISMAPINSTGDIYHILAYIILSRAYNKNVPPIYLTYDGGAVVKPNESNINVYTQVQRSLNFIQHLGYAQFFQNPLFIPGAGTRQNSRQDHVNTFFSGHFPGHHYIDQKALTLFIAHHIKRHGFELTAQRLRNGFSQHTIAQPLLAYIDARVTNERLRIQNYAGAVRPILILQIRYSSKANEEQNIDDNMLTRLKEYLEREYAVWFIFTDGRLSRSFDQIPTAQRTDPFPYAIEGADYGKIFHLRLMLNLYQLPRLVGIIGNTSGTLDIAAFTGHRVYNLHQFNNHISYQALRILIQGMFLSIEDFTPRDIVNDLRDPRGAIGNFTDAIFTKHFRELRNWLTSVNNPLLLAQRDFLTVNQVPQQLNGANCKELFYIENVTTHVNQPILGNAALAREMVTGKIHNNSFTTLLESIRDHNFERFQQKLALLQSQGFDINFIGPMQRTLLQWAVHFSLEDANPTQHKLALVLITVELLRHSAQVASIQRTPLCTLYMATRSQTTPLQIQFQKAVSDKLIQPTGQYFAPGY